MMGTGICLVCLLALPEVERDVAIKHFEITQGLQRKANDMPLVAGKPTVIRVFPQVIDGGDPIGGISARVHAIRAGQELQGSPISPNNGPITARSCFSRLMPQDSLNFTLDPDWYAKETEFWSELILPPGIVDLRPDDNRFPSGNATFTARYQPRRGLRILHLSAVYA